MKKLKTKANEEKPAAKYCASTRKYHTYHTNVHLISMRFNSTVVHNKIFKLKRRRRIKIKKASYQARHTATIHTERDADSDSDDDNITQKYYVKLPATERAHKE